MGLDTRVEKAADKVSDWYFQTEENKNKPLDEASLKVLWDQANTKINEEDPGLLEAYKTEALQAAFHRILAGTKRPVELEAYVRLPRGDSTVLLRPGIISRTKENWVERLRDGHLETHDLDVYRESPPPNDQDLLPYFLMSAARTVGGDVSMDAEAKVEVERKLPTLVRLCNQLSSVQFCKEVKDMEVKGKAADEDAIKRLMLGMQSSALEIQANFLTEGNPNPMEFRNTIENLRIQQFGINRLNSLLYASNLYQSDFLAKTYEENKCLVALLVSPVTTDLHGTRTMAREKVKPEILREGHPTRIALLSKPLDAIIDGATAPTIQPRYNDTYQKMKLAWNNRVGINNLAQMRSDLAGIHPRQARAIMERSIHESESISFDDPLYTGIDKTSDMALELKEWEKMGIDLCAIVAAKRAPILYEGTRRGLAKSARANFSPSEFQSATLCAFPNAPLWMLGGIHD